jgi:glycerol-3-phosphate dehydrogenase
MLLSKGAHVIVTKDAVGLGERAIVLPKTDDGRVLFIIPWAGHALIGTTDTAYSDSLFHPIVNDDDVKYLLEHVSRYLQVGSISALSTFAGLRALADTGAENTASASREHLIREAAPGYFQVAGGKLTTYRRIAADVAKMVCRRLSHKRKSRTKYLALVGAGGGHRKGDTLYARYGTLSRDVREFMTQMPEGTRLLSDGRTHLGEVRYAVEREAATEISDFSLRRTRLALLSDNHARDDAVAIADVMGAVLGWSDPERLRQIDLHENELLAEGL